MSKKEKMKNKAKTMLRGIRWKYMRLILVVMAMVAGVFLIMNLIQMSRLSTIVESTSRKQGEVISNFSEGALKTLVSRRLSNIAAEEADGINDLFWQSAKDARVLKDYFEKVLQDPEKFAGHEVKAPDVSLEGEVSAQLLTEEGVDLTDPGIQAEIQMLGSLSDVAVSLLGRSDEDALYVALPDGLMLLVDSHPSSKYTQDGTLMHVPIHERAWYRGAVEAGGLFFTDVYQDAFTGKDLVTCSVPVYHNGELAAVVGTDLFLEVLEEDVNQSYEGGDFICILDQNGKVVISPLTEGAFEIDGVEEDTDLRAYPDEQISTMVKSAYEKDNDAEAVEIEAGGEDVLMVGHPIVLPKWALLHGMKEDIVREPSVLTEEEIDALMSSAVFLVNLQIFITILTTIGLLFVVLVVALLFARKVSNRMVEPLEKMTRRIGSIKGEDLLFEMEDTYKTGDEIEVLAESFSDMSARTLQYVDQVKTVTAEKERIGAELHMATEIQASQLPNTFPAFPERKEFRLYASMDPAKEVGGDFYDFYFVDEKHIALIMADVTGKGVPAALFMMVARVLIKSHLQNGEGLGEALRNVNNQLCENNEAGLFVTVWAATIDLSTGKSVSVNAGHEHPALRKGDGLFEMVKYEHDLAVAVMEGVTFSEREFQLNPGDCLFVYTDGVAEAQNAEHVLFDTDRILEALNLEPMAEPEELIKNVTKGIDTFVAGAEQFDDITMLCFRYDGA